MFTLIKIMTQQEGCHLLKSHVSPFCCPFLALHLSKWPLSSHDLYNIHTGLARAIWTLVLMSDIVSITKKERQAFTQSDPQAGCPGGEAGFHVSQHTLVRSRASVNDIHFSGEIIIFRTVVYDSLWFSHRFLLFSSGLIFFSLFIVKCTSYTVKCAK